ncbi:hypothetical protein F2Q70_00038689 [Brassica cretica]|uniref:Uncharacterized protein n=1 Tax=Brassica cretica TaxID=69181 RepID=A0A8S9K0Z1_BRACR|nr:hypothetical protein F2Q70_00038689 [Brassica cretica]
MIFRRVIVKSLKDNNNECRGHSVWMGKGSRSRRRHMTEAGSSTKAGQRVVRQVHQIVMQYLLFRCSKGCVMIIHEEADGWGENGDVLVQIMHISWGRKTWCGAHLVGEKGTFGVKFPDVRPEVIDDVVAEGDIVLSDEDHVESRC